MSASKHLILNDLMTGLYRYILSLDFDLSTLTVFAILRNQMHEKIKIDSVQTVSEVSQKSVVKIVTYVIQKNVIKN